MLKGEFPLKEYSSQKAVEFSYGECKVKVELIHDNINSLPILTEEMNTCKETGSLTIQGELTEERCLQYAQDIRNLLSLALGKGLIFDRQFYSENGRSWNVDKAMSQSMNEGNQIVPDFELSRFMEQTLANWSALNKAEKDNLFVVIDYLNQTRHGFIEDRILRTVQAWESLAKSWGTEGNLDPRLNDLRRKIKIVYKSWRDENNLNEVDPHGELGNKIFSAIEQEKLLSKLNRMIAEANLDIDKLNLEISTLKSLRDQVAHTGKIEIKGKEAIPILESGIIGLQLIILKDLGYSGLVNSSKNGWTTLEPIADFFRS